MSGSTVTRPAGEIAVSQVTRPAGGCGLCGRDFEDGQLMGVANGWGPCVNVINEQCTFVHTNCA